MRFKIIEEFKSDNARYRGNQRKMWGEWVWIEGQGLRSNGWEIAKVAPGTPSTKKIHFNEVMKDQVEAKLNAL